MADCENCVKNCEETKIPENIPYVVHEANMARAERQSKRWMIAFFVALAMLFATNVGWIIYESQFETISYKQDGEGLNNVNVGEQGDINYGAKGTDTAEAQ